MIKKAIAKNSKLLSYHPISSSCLSYIFSLVIPVLDTGIQLGW
ncbi:hypothetical protein [Wolbachia endosymbiont (group A) of Anomoia purmunda]|nr:hypothetical protein [Wolbachia endosymbiont (group A) of Anomoia purmunda]